jgi:hypothetical protein
MNVTEIKDGQSFEDTTGVVFEKGPHLVDGVNYQYKLTDTSGIDYCTESQLISWGVKVKTVL